MLNAEKIAFTQQPQQDKTLMMAQEKKMALCGICGSFLIENDAAERTQSHITSKQHVGYGTIRDFLTEYKEKARKEERLAREREAGEHTKPRERGHGNRRRSIESVDKDMYRFNIMKQRGRNIENKSVIMKGLTIGIAEKGRKKEEAQIGCTTVRGTEWKEGERY
ncbi:luc7 3 [Olea europaea subsp. europaea]|uniref:Luc7 3 n=1 Tax=Olea europaea subsp. europaea TaxID=158383 RepID=A0A8S0RD84_OLEEU|nr:luc7 3 [Olea europaea subsp. europaea]